MEETPAVANLLLEHSVVCGEGIQGSITRPPEQVLGLSGRESRRSVKCQLCQGRLGRLFAVEDGFAIVDGWPPEALTIRSMADEVLAGNVLPVMIERRVKCLG